MKAVWMTPSQSQALGDPVYAIALSLGYESESAFRTAFKRVMGCSPRQYSRSRNLASPSHSEGEAARTNQLEPIPGSERI